jgi:hypothetical protein
MHKTLSPTLCGLKQAQVLSVFFFCVFFFKELKVQEIKSGFFFREVGKSFSEWGKNRPCGK